MCKNVMLMILTGTKKTSVSLSPSFLQVYANGIRNIDLHFIVRRLAAPVICVLLLCLCVPYTISKGVTPLLGMFLNACVCGTHGYFCKCSPDKEQSSVARGLISCALPPSDIFYFCDWTQRWPNYDE